MGNGVRTSSEWVDRSELMVSPLFVSFSRACAPVVITVTVPCRQRRGSA